MGNQSSNPLKLLIEWLESDEVKSKLRAISDRAMNQLWADVSIRVPTEKAERENGFSSWLSGYRERYVEYLSREFEKEFPNVGKHLNDPVGLWDLVVEGIWNDLCMALRQYAIRGLAFRWMATNLRDSFVPGEPDLNSSERIWDVPVLRRRDNAVVDHLYFDLDGSIIERKIIQAA